MCSFFNWNNRSLGLHIDFNSTSGISYNYIYRFTLNRTNYFEIVKIGLIYSKVPGKQAVGPFQGMGADKKIA